MDDLFVEVLRTFCSQSTSVHCCKSTGWEPVQLALLFLVLMEVSVRLSSLSLFIFGVSVTHFWGIW